MIKFDVMNRFSGAVQFTAELECSEDECYSVKLGLAVKWALKARAYLADAYLADANLAGAYLADANLAGAYLARANLARAYLAGANLARAYLAGANLADAYLADANLAGAYLAGAYLAGAKGIVPERSTPLLMLLDQPGKIRAYKLVDADLRSPIQSSGKLKYEIGKTISVEDANTNPNDHCAAGVNVATLDWCLSNWREGNRVLVVEFEAKDIACIPTATDGKFRLFRCDVVAEKTLDLVALGLKKPEKVEAA
jgi:uncharacterized protein YjbI with pentapeptide repeats